MGITALLMQANALVDLKSPRSEKKVASDVLCLQGFRLALQLNLYTLLSGGVFLTCRFVLKYFAKLAQTIWLNNKHIVHASGIMSYCCADVEICL